MKLSWSFRLWFLLFSAPIYSQVTPPPPRKPSLVIPAPTVPQTVQKASIPQISVTFNPVTVKQIGFAIASFKLPANESIQGKPTPTISVDGQSDQSRSAEFKYDVSCPKDTTRDCVIVFGFVPSVKGTINATLDLTSSIEFKIKAEGVDAPTADQTAASNTSCSPDHAFAMPTLRIKVLPPGTNAPAGAEHLAEAVQRYFGDPLNSNNREKAINCFYSSDQSLTVFNQFQSIYNGASSSSTVVANIGSYSFNNGVQLSLGTNIQAGPGTSSSSSTNASFTNVPPTISAQSAAQSAQNLFYGGNIYVYGLLPVLATPVYPWTRLHFDAGALLREGVDVQNFNAASITGTSPNSHFNALLESYLQYDANPSTSSGTTPLSVFLGSEFGYAYTSHGYAREFGFINNTNSRIADVSIGLLVNGHFNVAVSRAFGPSQTYIDSTTKIQTTQNYFKSYSFAIQYQGGIGVGK